MTAVSTSRFGLRSALGTSDRGHTAASQLKPGDIDWERIFGEAREEVIAALEAIKRTEGVQRYRRELRKREKHKVEVFADVLERGLELPEEK